jgi:hypothetical protein
VELLAWRKTKNDAVTAGLMAFKMEYNANYPINLMIYDGFL